MQTDATQSSGEHEVSTDLCIIGAGPAGISLARELDGSDIRICLIESGGVDMERRMQRELRGESDGYPLRRLDRSRIRAFGGALRHPKVGSEGWAARPLDPIDFEPRPAVPNTGWPFSRDDLDPYYARAQAGGDLAAYEYEPEQWSEGGRKPLPLEGNGVETTMFQFGQPSFHEGLKSLSISHNVQVQLSSRVVGLTVGADGRRIDGVVVQRPDRSRVVLRPRVVVLAAGGIENARLLLLADNMRGVGNEHDLVGRFFAERFSAYVGHIAAARPDLVDQAGLYQLHNVRGTLVRGALRVADKVQRDRGLRNCAFFVVAAPAKVTTDAVRSLASLRKATERRPSIDSASFRRHVMNVARGSGDIAAFAAGHGSSSSVLTLRAQGEQAPNRESRVTLGSHRDGAGLPVARVTWRMDDDDMLSLRSSLDLVDAALRSSGLGSVREAWDPPPLIEGNYHHLGTTRMHLDPRFGVVDANCRVHSVPNLYIAGSSVFPTYGSSNPTLTLVALAMRLADHLRQKLIR